MKKKSKTEAIKKESKELKTENKTEHKTYVIIFEDEKGFYVGTTTMKRLYQT